MPDKNGVSRSKNGADTPRPRLGWLALFQTAIIALVITVTRFARHYTGEGTLEDRLERLRQSPLDGGVQAIAWDDRGWVAALVAMVGALLLMLPIAWAYVATRERKKVDHSVVATITLMPMAVAAILVIVQDSLAVAFSLAGIAGVVRFRSALDDTKDAMYVFVAIAVGLGAGVGAMEASATLSALYNLVAVALWQWNAEPPPIAEIALDEQKAPKGRSWLQALLPHREPARHPAPVAEWLRPEEAVPLMDGAREDGNGSDHKREGLLRVHAADDNPTRQAVEEVLEEYTKHWALESDDRDGEGLPTLIYQVRLKKRHDPEELLARLHDRLGPELAHYTPAEPAASANG
ncbi:MAG: DUF4956 domain-containing protein [Gemmatimonadales bacterium]